MDAAGNKSDVRIASNFSYGQHLMSTVVSGSETAIFKDGQYDTNTVTTLSGSEFMRFNYHGGDNRNSTMLEKSQELIIWGSNQTASLSDIETNINNYFNIY